MAPAVGIEPTTYSLTALLPYWLQRLVSTMCLISRACCPQWAHGNGLQKRRHLVGKIL